MTTQGTWPGPSPGATAGDQAHGGGLTRHDRHASCTDLVAIITDGSRGPGREVVRELAHRGFAIVVGYITNHVAADAVVEDVLAAGGTAFTVRADVADELDVERLFTEATEVFTGVDVVVVNATGDHVSGPGSDRDLDRFDAMQRAVVRGTFLVNRQAARYVRKGGTIVYLLDAAIDPAVATDAAATASRAAVEALTRVHARELRGHHITVNAVGARPGDPGGPSDIALVVAFLVDGDGRSLNGQTIHVDGGSPDDRNQERHDE